MNDCKAIRKRLMASTLVEILILMILSGIVFLSVMDGLGLLRRFLDRTSQRIAGHTEQYAGYFRTVDLTGDSDSLLAENERSVALYRRGGIHARLSLADSALIVRQDERSDTLLRGSSGCGPLPIPDPEDESIRSSSNCGRNGTRYWRSASHPGICRTCGWNGWTSRRSNTSTKKMQRIDR